MMPLVDYVDISIVEFSEPFSATLTDASNASIV